MRELRHELDAVFDHGKTGVASAFDFQVQYIAFGRIFSVNLQFCAVFGFSVANLGEIFSFYHESRQTRVGIFRIV